MAAMTLSATGLQSNDQAFTNCAYVAPGELAKLSAAAGVEADVAAKKGLLCAVGEAVLLVRALESAMPGKVYVSMAHRLAGQLSLDKPCAVKHFVLPAPPFFFMLSCSTMPCSVPTRYLLGPASML